MQATILALFLATGSAADGPLTDAALVEYASRFHGSRDWASFPRNGVIGVLGGVKVVAEVHCSDLCPQYTRLVIHYDVQPGPACDRIGGVAEQVSIPVSIEVIDRIFCVPRVLAEKHLYSAP